MKYIGQNVFELPTSFRNDIFGLCDHFRLTCDDVRFYSENLKDPLFQLRNEKNDANGPRLRLTKVRTSGFQPLLSGITTDATALAGQDNDVCGTFEFMSSDSLANTQIYAQLQGTIHDASSGAESGKLSLGVASHDGDMATGLVLTGGSVDAEVDVSIGSGNASVTTISGTLNIINELSMGEPAVSAMDSAGRLTVAGQTGITSVGTLTGLTTSGAIELGHASDTTIARSSAGVITVEGKEVRTIDRNIQIIHSAFRDDIGTTAHFIPWHTVTENTSNTNENIPFIAPYPGKLLELHYRTSKNTSGATATWELVHIEKSETVITGNITTLDTQTCTGPTNAASGAGNLVKVTFDSDAAFNAGDMLALKITHDTDVTDSNTKFYITTIWEYDFSSM